MAAHNFNGSTVSTGVSDPFAAPLHTGPEQPLVRAAGPDSELVNPGTAGGDDRPPARIPMRPAGLEDQGDALFSLHPRHKG